MIYEKVDTMTNNILTMSNEEIYHEIINNTANLKYNLSSDSDMSILRKI